MNKPKMIYLGRKKGFISSTGEKWMTWLGYDRKRKKSVIIQKYNFLFSGSGPEFIAKYPDHKCYDQPDGMEYLSIEEMHERYGIFPEGDKDKKTLKVKKK